MQLIVCLPISKWPGLFFCEISTFLEIKKRIKRETVFTYCRWYLHNSIMENSNFRSSWQSLRSRLGWKLSKSVKKDTFVKVSGSYGIRWITNNKFLSYYSGRSWFDSYGKNTILVKFEPYLGSNWVPKSARKCKKMYFVQVFGVFRNERNQWDNKIKAFDIFLEDNITIHAENLISSQPLLPEKWFKFLQ